MTETGKLKFDIDKVAFEFNDPSPQKAVRVGTTYRILVVDDEDVIHKVTDLALRTLVFEGHPIELIHVYSRREAVEALKSNCDIAVTLLDVVMETDDAGLKLVQYIREDLKNETLRIILRTGYPGVAPEARVMLDYDINDYRSKTELTATNLISSVMGCLRNYRDIMKINTYKYGLEKVIHSTSMLFNYESLGLTNFLSGILEQLNVLIESQNALVLANRHFQNGRLVTHEGNYRVIAATGKYESFINLDYSHIKELLEIEPLLFESGKVNSIHQVDPNRKYYLAGHSPSIKNHTESYIYIINANITQENESFINLFLKNLSLSLDNYLLEQDTDEAMSEMLRRLSSLLEARDSDTGCHIHRVADMAALIGKEVHIENQELKNFKIASMIHDVGKIGIKDDVLFKPGKLTPEEFEYIKTHALIGGRLFMNSKHQLLKMAEQIARCHHERWDGTGYPMGICGEEIPIYARIVSIVDVFDAISHDRVYHKAWPIEESKAYIASNKGKMFDPELVDIFLKKFDDLMAIYNFYKINPNGTREDF